MRQRSILALAAATGALVVALTGIAQAAPAARRSLSAFDGPGFVIGMGKKKVAHGQFRITIRDKVGHPQLPPDGPGPEQEDRGGLRGHGHVERHAEARHVQVRVRPAPHIDEGDDQGHVVPQRYRGLRPLLGGSRPAEGPLSRQAAVLRAVLRDRRLLRLSRLG